MGSTLDMLERQWACALKRKDYEGAKRINMAIATIETKTKIETLAKHFAGKCAWENTDTCRMCVAPESGKCPMIHVDVAV